MLTAKVIIGRMIKNRRIKCGYTLKELADKLDVERQYVWRLENGKVNISANYIDKILKQLEITSEEFFGQTHKNL